jgi:hypothetical protein
MKLPLKSAAVTAATILAVATQAAASLDNSPAPRKMMSNLSQPNEFNNLQEESMGIFLRNVTLIAFGLLTAKIIGEIINPSKRVPIDDRLLNSGYNDTIEQPPADLTTNKTADVITINVKPN